MSGARQLVAWWRKDVRQLGVPAGLLAMAMVVQTVMILRTRTGRSGAVEGWNMLWTFPTADLVAMVVAGLVVLADPPARRAAFWQVQPIPTARLVVAKLAPIVLAVAVLAGLHALILARWVTETVGPKDAAVLLADSFLNLAGLAGIGMIIASLVRRSLAFAAALIVVVGCAHWLDGLGSLLAFWIRPEAPPPTLAASHAVLRSLLLAAGGLAVLALQIARRDRRLGLAAAVAVALAAVAVPSLPIDLMARPAKAEVRAARLALWEPRWQAEHRLVDGDAMVYLTARAAIALRPAGVVYRVAAIETLLTLDDGSVRRQRISDVLGSALGCARSTWEAMLRHGMPMDGVDDPCAEPARRDFTLAAAPLDAGWPLRVRSVRAEVTAEALTLDARAVPFDHTPARLTESGGNRLVLLAGGVELRHARPIVALRGEVLHARRLPEPPPPVLYHPARRQIAKPMERGTSTGGLGLIFARRPAIRVGYPRFDRLAADAWIAQPPIAAVDPSWLKGAQVVVFHGRAHGRVRWTVEVGRPIDDRSERAP